MGGGGAESFSPAYRSHLLLLVALLGPLMVQSMVWKLGTLSTVSPDGTFSTHHLLAKDFCKLH